MTQFALKLLHTVPNHHMVQFIINIISNCCFLLKMSDWQSSQMCRLRNGVPQCSILAPIPSNINISDIPHTTALRYGYANDLALLHSLAPLGMIIPQPSTPCALTITYSEAEYAAPMWCRTTYKKAGHSLYDTIQIITGCLRPISTPSSQYYQVRHHFTLHREHSWTSWYD